MLSLDFYLMTIPQMFFLSIFICLIYKKNDQIKFLNCLLFTFLQTIIVLLYYILIVPYFATTNIQMIYYMPTIIFSLLLIVIGFLQARTFQKQFQINLFIALSQHIIYMTSHIIIYLIDLILSLVGVGILSSVIFSNALIILIMIVAIFISYQHFSRIIDTPFLENKKTNTLLFISIFIVIYIFYLLYEFNRGDFKMAILAIAIIGLCIGAMKLFEHISDITKQEYETKLKNVELQHQKSTYQQVEKSIETLSQTRHDMIYILTHIKNMNENAQYEEIKNFISEQIVRLEKMQKPVITGNSTLDYVIYEFMPRFHKINGHLTCNSYDGKCPITNVVYYAIVGEMLDIAIEYCKDDKNPTVMVQHGISHNRYYTKIKFSCTSELNNDLLVHLKELLTQYHYDYMENKDVNMYEIGFLLT